MDEKDVIALERIIHDAADVFEECLDLLDEDRPLLDVETLFKRPVVRARIAEWCTSVDKYVADRNKLRKRKHRES